MARLGTFGVAARDLQAEAEVDTFEFAGVEFAIADQLGSLPMLRWASAATSGIGVDDLEALAVTYDMIRDCLVPDAITVRVEGEGDRETLHLIADGEEIPEGTPVRMVQGWPAFQAAATRSRARTGDLMPIVYAIWESLSGRPTQRSSDSSGGPSTASESSKGSSSSEESSDPKPRELDTAPAYPPGLVLVDQPGPIMSDPRLSTLRTVDESAHAIATTSG